jgi:hypothetical protein
MHVGEKVPGLSTSDLPTSLVYHEQQLEGLHACLMKCGSLGCWVLGSLRDIY